MKLDELRMLRSARGFFVLTTADVEQSRRILNSELAFHEDGASAKLSTWWMKRKRNGAVRLKSGAFGASNEVLRVQSHNGTLDKELEAAGYVTRIDFFVPGETTLVYDVAKTLLRAGFLIASPSLAGTRILSELTLFYPSTR